MGNKSILIFGAGKIGRSFIGQLFSRSGYQIIFIDVDQVIINELNSRNRYRVVIKAEHEEQLEVTNVCGIYANDKESVINAIAQCGLMATCVGKNALPKVLPLISQGIEKRYAERPDFPLDIILAENIRDACMLMRNGLSILLNKEFPIDRYVGLIETSIGKMVPIMLNKDVEEDHLQVFAEPYNTLILDKLAFKNPVPDIEGLAPKENIKAWVDRKAFIHNLGHATAAYYGAYKYPKAKYVYEVLEDMSISGFVRDTMYQSAFILHRFYPNDFSMEDLAAHIDDLLFRFQNKALKDTIFRVGQDRLRKLGPEDRFVGIIRLALSQRMPYDKILKAMAYAFNFQITDENGNRSVQDVLFDNYGSKGIGFTLLEVCGFDPVKDKDLILELAEYVQKINRAMQEETVKVSGNDKQIKPAK